MYVFIVKNLPKIAGTSPRRINFMNPEGLGFGLMQRQVFADCFGVDAIDEYRRRFPQLTLDEISKVLRPIFNLLPGATVHNSFGSLIEGGLKRAVSSKPSSLKDPVLK